MSDAVYYEKPVLLDRAKHKRLRVRTSTSFAFARKANSVYLAGVEFNEAMKEYAIVFTRAANGRVVPVAMLGLRTRENLFVAEGERWDAVYVPAFIRRYPFVLAQLGGEQLGVCIDEAYGGFNTKEGEALFDEQGGNTPFLANAVQFLENYQREFARTEMFCARLEQFGLFKEMNAQAHLKDGRSFTVSNLLVVDEPRLMTLPDAIALSLFRSGELHLVSMHLASLSNMQRLTERIVLRAGPMEPAPKPA
ncbi:SapC family protein [Ramlibacter sp. PS4R-6]|uniref:SapC family protein n=1 Tax=Ramlibacter sp. PS4R-6 TaxID=3133438 RepID=UPI0030A89038